MSEINFLLDLIPEATYKYIVAILIGLFVFKNKIPILNKIDIKFHFPEEFMRSFRWITPLLVFGIYIWLFILNLKLNRAIAVLAEKLH